MTTKSIKSELVNAIELVRGLRLVVPCDSADRLPTEQQLSHFRVINASFNAIHADVQHYNAALDGMEDLSLLLTSSVIISNYSAFSGSFQKSSKNTKTGTKQIREE